MAFEREGFGGNPRLRKAGEEIPMTEEQIKEYAKCKVSVEYFLENYAKIISLDHGEVYFKPFKFQRKALRLFQKNRKVLVKLFRQAGKSTIVAGYVAWYVLFNDDPKHACILANKLAIAQEIFSKVKMMVELCPKWLQRGILVWNETSFKFENETKCFCAATSDTAVRGLSLNLLILDEFAFLSPNMADKFIASVFPTISSSETSQLIIVSTPKGLNHFYKMWVEAERGENGFVPFFAHWTEHPKRNQKWANEQKAILGELKYRQEVLCEWLGSSDTLIDGSKLASIPTMAPIAETPDGFRCFLAPEKDHNYVMTVDVSEGVLGDYSTFVIFDVNTLPYKIVATYRNNTINPLAYPEVLVHYGNMYNQAFILVETNSLGQQVADALFYDLEYENMYVSLPSSASSEILEGGNNRTKPGYKTTKKTKMIGCNTIKLIIESDKMEINDINIVSEASTFSRKGSSYEAEEGKHDDLMMCLVGFGYLTTTNTFKYLFDFSLRQEYIKDQMKRIEEDHLPMGFFTNGLEDEQDDFVFV